MNILLTKICLFGLLAAAYSQVITTEQVNLNSVDFDIGAVPSVYLQDVQVPFNVYNSFGTGGFGGYFGGGYSPDLYSGFGSASYAPLFSGGSLGFGYSSPIGLGANPFAFSAGGLAATAIPSFSTALPAIASTIAPAFSTIGSTAFPISSPTAIPSTFGLGSSFPSVGTTIAPPTGVIGSLIPGQSVGANIPSSYPSVAGGTVSPPSINKCPAGFRGVYPDCHIIKSQTNQINYAPISQLTNGNSPIGNSYESVDAPAVNPNSRLDSNEYIQIGGSVQKGNPSSGDYKSENNFDGQYTPSGAGYNDDRLAGSSKAALQDARLPGSVRIAGPQSSQGIPYDQQNQYNDAGSQSSYSTSQPGDSYTGNDAESNYDQQSSRPYSTDAKYSESNYSQSDKKRQLK